MGRIRVRSPYAAFCKRGLSSSTSRNTPDKSKSRDICALSVGQSYLCMQPFQMSHSRRAHHKTGAKPKGQKARIHCIAMADDNKQQHSTAQHKENHHKMCQASFITSRPPSTMTPASRGNCSADNGSGGGAITKHLSLLHGVIRSGRWSAFENIALSPVCFK